MDLWSRISSCQGIATPFRCPSIPTKPSVSHVPLPTSNTSANTMAPPNVTLSNSEFGGNTNTPTLSTPTLSSTLPQQITTLNGVSTHSMSPMSFVPNTNSTLTPTYLAYMNTTTGVSQIVSTSSSGIFPTVSSEPLSMADPAQASSSGSNTNAHRVQNNVTKSVHKNISAIVGGVVGGLVFLALIIFGVRQIWRRRQAIRTAPSSEFLTERRFPFSGRSRLLSQRIESYGVNDEDVEDTTLPMRERSPSPQNEGVGLAY